MPKWNQAFFENRAYPDAVLFPASLAHPQEAFVALAGLTIRHLVNVGISATRTARAGFAPTLVLEKLDRSSFIGASFWHRGHDCGFIIACFSLSFCHDFNIAHRDICVKYHNPGGQSRESAHLPVPARRVDRIVFMVSRRRDSDQQECYLTGPQSQRICHFRHPDRVVVLARCRREYQSPPTAQLKGSPDRELDKLHGVRDRQHLHLYSRGQCFNHSGLAS